MNKIHRCKPNTTCTGLTCCKLYNDDERNQARSKNWRDIIFMNERLNIVKSVLPKLINSLM